MAHHGALSNNPYDLFFQVRHDPIKPIIIKTDPIVIVLPDCAEKSLAEMAVESRT